MENKKKITIGNQTYDVYRDGRVIRRPSKDSMGRNIPQKEMTIKPSGEPQRRYLSVMLGGKLRKHHRVLAKAFLPDFSENLEVDHINGNKLDNRIENLRMADRRGNCIAARKHKTNTSSIYRGVTKLRNRWTARVTEKGGARKWLGSFSTELDAAKAFNKAAIRAGYPDEALNMIF